MYNSSTIIAIILYRSNKKYNANIQNKQPLYRSVLHSVSFLVLLRIQKSKLKSQKVKESETEKLISQEQEAKKPKSWVEKLRRWKAEK